jgi:hypothetical protein
MDVTGSLRKIGRELLALEREDPDLETRLQAASWLITYIADCLDVELQHAAARGRLLALQQLEQAPGPNGVRDFSIMKGEDI